MNRHALALQQVLIEFLPLAQLQPGQLLVVGCSTSEVLGKTIGKASSKELGQEFYRVISEACFSRGICPAFQCCEHLNRALVIERSAAAKYALEEVTVVPVPGAGGSLAAAAFEGLAEPAVVESIRAHAGIDIGDTFIGMHLKPVAIPVRISVNSIGGAHLTLARVRPKLIGGSRAVYASGTCS